MSLQGIPRPCGQNATGGISFSGERVQCGREGCLHLSYILESSWGLISLFLKVTVLTLSSQVSQVAGLIVRGKWRMSAPGTSSFFCPFYLFNVFLTHVFRCYRGVVARR